MNKFLKFLAVFLVGLLTSNVYAQVGNVILAKGDVYLVNQDNQTRPLQRHSTISEGDTLITATDGEVQIRFTDNTVLALRASSRFKIDEYHAQTKTLITLYSGGFRSFGHADKSSYQINTLNVNIAVHSSHFEVVVEDDELYVGAYNGEVTLKNASGRVNLGRDNAFSYALVQTPKGQIQGLFQPPTILTQALVTKANAPAFSNEEIKADHGAAIQDQDEDIWKIEYLVANDISPPEQPRPLITVVKPEIQRLKLQSQSTELAITELNNL